MAVSRLRNLPPSRTRAHLPRLHLRLTVVLVVKLLRRSDQVKHVSADEKRTQLLKVAVLLILNLCHTPKVVTSLDGPAIASLHVLRRANDGEGHSAHERLCMLCAGLVVDLDGRRVDADALRVDDFADALLEDGEVLGAERVGLGDDGDEVDAGAEALHHLDVEGLRVRGRGVRVRVGTE